MIARRSSRRLAGVRPLALAAQLQLGLAAGLDGLGQADLVVLGQQRVLPDVGQVEPDEVFLVALDALLRQGPARPSRSRFAARRLRRSTAACPAAWCRTARIHVDGVWDQSTRRRQGRPGRRRALSGRRLGQVSADADRRPRDEAGPDPGQDLESRAAADGRGHGDVVGAVHQGSGPAPRPACQASISSRSTSRSARIRARRRPATARRRWRP